MREMNLGGGLSKDRRRDLAARIYSEFYAASQISTKAIAGSGSALLLTLLVQLIYCTARDVLLLCEEYPAASAWPMISNTIRVLQLQTVRLRTVLGLSDKDEEPTVGYLADASLVQEDVSTTVNIIRQITSYMQELGVPPLDSLSIREVDTSILKEV